ncbi:MAG TPA: hypothetical protein VEH83_01645 [Gemmatimonadales bacterium]|nr:hypothetical protein [Gemmatimonadales bacterium]
MPAGARPFTLGSAAALVAALALAAAGCDTGAAKSTAPAPPTFTDASAVSAGIATLDSVLATPPLLGLIAMGGLMVATSTPAQPAVTAALSCASVGRAAGPAAAAFPARDARAPLGQASLIADSLYGHVFVYDTAAGGYRLAADTGGPAQGVRFLLYAVNQYARALIPLTTVGWLDLSDRSAGGSLAAQAHIQGAAAGLADYLVTLSGTQAADTAVLSGTISDGVHTFTWRDSTAHAGFETVIAATAADSAADVRLQMYAARTSFDPFDYNDTLDFAWTHGGETVRLTGHILTYCLIPDVGLAASVSGQAFASVTNGTGTTPAVTGIGGATLTASQVQAILDLENGQQRLYQGLFALLTPAALLLPP